MKYILSYKVRPNKGENKMYTQKVMTYDQWQRRFKRALRKTIKQNFFRSMEFLVLTVMVTMPIWMFVDWILRGY